MIYAPHTYQKHISQHKEEIIACHGKSTDIDIYDDLADEYGFDPQWLRNRHEQELDECPFWKSSREHIEFLIIFDEDVEAEERIESGRLFYGEGDW